MFYDSPSKPPDGPGLVALALLLGVFAGVFLRLPSAPDGGDRTRVELHLCNHSRESKLYAAVAAYDPVLGQVVARGWFPQHAGQCRPVLANLMPPIYVFAESKDGSQRWQGQDGPQFCLEGDGPFTTSARDCVGSSRRFFPINVQAGSKVQVWTFDDKGKS